MNLALRTWVKSVADATGPDRVVWYGGTDEETRAIETSMVADGSFLELDQARYPRCYLHRSHPSDVARTEHLTFICSKRKEDAGPTNHWMSPEEAEAKVWPLLEGSMRGRTMYVVPYLMGPPGSPYRRVGVELTDSAYVVANLRLMTRCGEIALAELGDSSKFVRGIHSLGDLSPERRFVCHFPETQTIWAVGTGYGGNAMLSKKSHGLRLAGAEGRDHGWMAEHMLVLGLTDPRGNKTFVAAAFPSKCGKTNLAMLVSRLPGYQVETLGDDICWMHVGADGWLWAINPEYGMFGAARSTSEKTNPNAMRALRRDAIFTNVALRPDGSPWWEGMGEEPVDGMLDWKGQPWRKGSSEPASHPNARFTIALKASAGASPAIDDPQGVPISAIIFGGRRVGLSPLVMQATSWEHGVYLGATLVSETTAAATGVTGIPRHDPMAMLPFCGYHMADYFAHWLSMGRKASRPPAIFHVNWFRRGPDGKYLWPGFGENVRVLKWIAERVRGEADAEQTIIGHIPTKTSLDLSGLDLPEDNLERLLEVDPIAWKEEAEAQRAFLGTFGPKLPDTLWREHEELTARIRDAELTRG
jgi:phosphoenolpyruvate carboxykinase (GTP)